MNRLKSQLQILHVLRDAKCQARRASLAPADDLIKPIIECATNTHNGNYKLTKDKRSKLSKYKNRLRALIDPKISYKSKRKLLIQKGGFMVVFCRA